MAHKTVSSLILIHNTATIHIRALPINVYNVLGVLMDGIGPETSTFLKGGH